MQMVEKRAVCSVVATVLSRDAAKAGVKADC